MAPPARDGRLRSADLGSTSPKPPRAAYVVVALAAGCAGADEPLDLPRVEVSRSHLRALSSHPPLDGVRDVALVKGAVWVLTGTDPFLHRYDLGAGSRIDFGSRGRGPGEMLNPWTIVSGDDGSPECASVWDPGNRRLVAFDCQGRALATVPFAPPASGPIRDDIRRTSYGDPFRVARIDGGYLAASFPDGVTRTSDFRRGRLTRFDPHGQSARTVLDLSGPVDGAGSVARSTDLVPIPLWDGCGPDLVAVWLPEERTVRWLDGGGAEVGAVRIPAEERELRDDEIRGYLGRMAELELEGRDVDPRDVERAIERILDRGMYMFGGRAPLAVDLLCEPGGRVWLRLFDSATDALGMGREWLVTNGSAAMTRVAMPAGFTPFLGAGDALVGTDTDPMGLQRLVAVDLDALATLPDR